MYESKCVECNHNKEKFQKDGMDLIDGRPNPSIYVGESGLSLHERSKEHWAAYEARSGDSHTLKHWITNPARCGQVLQRLSDKKGGGDSVDLVQGQHSEQLGWLEYKWPKQTSTSRTRGI